MNSKNHFVVPPPSAAALRVCPNARVQPDAFARLRQSPDVTLHQFGEQPQDAACRAQGESARKPGIVFAEHVYGTKDVFTTFATPTVFRLTGTPMKKRSFTWTAAALALVGSASMVQAQAQTAVCIKSHLGVCRAWNSSAAKRPQRSKPDRLLTGGGCVTSMTSLD